MPMVKIKVAQKDGEVVITPGGPGEPRTYSVENHIVSVHHDHVDEFLRNVDGSELVKPAGDSGGNPAKKEA